MPRCNRHALAAAALRRGLALSVALALACGLLSCAHQRPDPGTAVVLIESSPLNLDPRIGTDAQSERIDQLLFDGLLTRNEHFELEPGLAERYGVRSIPALKLFRAGALVAEAAGAQPKAALEHWLEAHGA